MAFTFEKLNRLNLKRGEWIHIKYPTIDHLVAGQVATNRTFNIKSYPIFDSSNTKFYFQLPSQTNPSTLNIDKIEFFMRTSSQPILFEIDNQFKPDLKHFGNLNQGAVYEFLKVNGNIESLRFHSISLGGLINDTKRLQLYYKKDNGEIDKTDFKDIIDVI